MSNTSSILVTGASRGIGKATARDRSSYLTGSDRLQARGRSRLLVKAVMALIALTAMAAAMFAVPATAHAAPASTKLVWIPRAGYRIAAFVHPGRGPAIVLCHGFPDNHHLYDRVVPLLKGHEVVTFDFLGWGQSSKPSPLFLHLRGPGTGSKRCDPRPPPRPGRPRGARRQRAGGAQLGS